MSPYKCKTVKDIFSVDKTLTRNLSDNFAVSQSTWLDPKQHWFVIFHKGVWIAYGGIRVHDTDSMYSGPTYVKAEYRGQGLQLYLIKKRLRLAKKLGFKKVISSTYDTNYPSMNNLIKSGFLLRPTWMEHHEQYTLYWEKIL